MQTQIFSSTPTHALAARIAALLRVQLSPVSLASFHGGEIQIQLKAAVSSDNVCIMQPIATNVHDQLIELCLMAKAIRKAGAKIIIALMPYFAYSRQELGTTLIADILHAAEIDHLITLDLHQPRLQKAFKCSVHNLSPHVLFGAHIQAQDIHKPLIVAPDIGAIQRAERLAAYLNTNLAFIVKRRRHSHIQTLMLFADQEIKNHNCILLDDIIDSAQTICAAIQHLQLYQAKKIYVYATHGLLQESASSMLVAAPCKKIMLTNTIHIQTNTVLQDKLESICAAGLFADCIRFICA